MPSTARSGNPKSAAARSTTAATLPSEASAGGGLRYSTDAVAGIARRRRGRLAEYRFPDGARVSDQAVADRIRALAIPPAWTDVWICIDPHGHLQATGRDARGRKQYRYHATFRRGREDAKFARVASFGRALPHIRRRMAHDLARPGLTREKVLATVIWLLDSTAMRVGNDEYARTNRTYGLVTLRNRHVEVSGTLIRIRFRGKAGRVQEVGVRDRRVATIVARCQDLPGQELFHYLDTFGTPHTIASDDVNAYLRDAAATDVTAKDFRTWAGTLLAFRLLAAAQPAAGQAARHTVAASVDAVADVLGNTRAVSRASYVAPAVVDGYLAGSLPRMSVGTTATAAPSHHAATRRQELALVHFLEAGRGTGLHSGRPTARA